MEELVQLFKKFSKLKQGSAISKFVQNKALMIKSSQAKSK